MRNLDRSSVLLFLSHLGSVRLLQESFYDSFSKSGQHVQILAEFMSIRHANKFCRLNKIEILFGQNNFPVLY